MVFSAPGTRDASAPGRDDDVRASVPLPMSESPRVHPSAQVSPQAQIAAGVEIGPGCVVSPEARLGEGVKLLGNVYIAGPVEIGARTVVYPFTCLGFPPQDYKFTRGMPTAGVRIGADCIIREHVTIHAASKTAHPTTTGDRCFLMVNSHMGHDTVIGNNVILVNGVLLAGHVRVFDNATISGNACVQQFTRIGRLAFMSGAVVATQDLPPFCTMGIRNTITGLNVVGMRRNGIPRDEITLVRRAFGEAYRERVPREEMVARLADLASRSTHVAEFRDFIADRTGRAIAPARISRMEEEAVEA